MSKKAPTFREEMNCEKRIRNVGNVHCSVKVGMVQPEFTPVEIPPVEYLQREGIISYASLKREVRP
ncbi:MAG: hypothetical protein ACP5TI_05125 [Thermoprotei archaeon]